MNNHLPYYSLWRVTSQWFMARGNTTHALARARTKNLLTFEQISRSIKSLTKTCSGKPHPKDFAVFLRLLQAQTRHFYDGLSVPNTTPFEGISTAVYRQLVITRRLYLNEAAFTKLKPVGGLIMPNSTRVSTAKAQKPFGKINQTDYNNRALAKSSVSDWRRYNTVTQARHYFQFVLFLYLNSLQFMVDCARDFMSATSVCSTPTRIVCRPYWRKGSSVNTLTQEANHA